MEKLDIERTHAEADPLSSIAKAARILQALATSRAGDVGVTDLAVRVDLAKSTVHRVLAELMSEGMVGRSGQRYRLGPAWFALQPALANSEWVRLSEQAKQPLAELFERSGATVHLGVLDGTQVLYLEKLTGKGGTTLPTRVGAHMPATCTALGKCLLAHAEPGLVRSILMRPLPVMSRGSVRAPRVLLGQLDEVRRTGLAYDREETRPGIFCVAAPVIRANKVVASVSLSRVYGHVLEPRDAYEVSLAATRVAEWFGEPVQNQFAHRKAGLAVGA